MKMKSYKATFFRHNPQFKNGGYVTERKIEAVSLPSARKRAREISEHCVYGSMELLDMRILWDSFSDDEKPEWTSLEEIERFSKKMLEEEIY